MNPPDAVLREPAEPSPVAIAAPQTRLAGKLAVAAGGAASVLVALLVAGQRPNYVGLAGRLHTITAEAQRSGVAGAVLGALLIAFVGLVACAAMSDSRRAANLPMPQPSRGRRPRLRTALAAASQPMAPGRMARVGQGNLVPLLAGLTAAAAWWLRPAAGAWAALPAPNDAFLLAGGLIALAFPALVAERTIVAVPPRALPEVAALRCLVLLPVLALPIAGLIEIARGLGHAWAAWIATALDVGLALIAAELALRALARWFVPAPPDAQARAAVDSLLAMLAAGIARPRRAAGENSAAVLRSHFGLDFSRSWALGYLRRATLPAIVLTALFCWALSGVTLVPLDRRDIYESYGAPVAVFGPGLHLGLPWPLGRVRAVEQGAVHSIALGGGFGALGGEAGSNPAVATYSPLRNVSPAAPIAAEAPPGPQDDRLWTGTHPAEADYLIASPARDAGAPRAGLQIISADLRVLWRVGLTEADARRAAYAVADPDTLVRAQAGRVVARFFAARTLDDVMNERRETMAAELRATLAGQVSAADAGIEILAVVVEAVHPPAGAADAYHAVQAAQIASQTSISTERGRAHGTDSLAHEAARTLTDTAQATAAEIEQGARADAVRFTADIHARAAAGRVFLVERYFDNIAAALSKSPLTIIDDRLGPQDSPMIDLRPPASLALPQAGPGDPD